MTEMIAMWKTTVWRRIILAWCVALAAQPLVATGGSPSTNVTVKVTVATAACILDPDDTTISLDFKNIINRDLQPGHKLPGQKFDIHLTNCDPQVKDAVVVTMTAENRINGLISSSKEGIAVGLETTGGIAVPVNGQPGPSFSLTTGDNAVTLMAYVTATGADPTPGPFQASANFKLEYP